MVRWSLVKTVDVAPVLEEGCGDGSELYARHSRDFAAYRRFEPAFEGPLDT